MATTDTQTGAGVVPVTRPAVRHRPGEHPHRLGDAAIYIALIVLSALFTFPFLWLVLTSLRPPEQIFAPGFWPSHVQTQNYTDVFKNAPVATWFKNSIIVTVLGVIAVVMSSSLIAYGFARLRFRGRNQLFGLVVATQLLPAAATMVPTFLIWNGLHLVNTLFPLWLGNIFGSAFYIFMLRQFLIGIPQDLIDAARIDGASYLGIYWRIMLPLIRPALAAVAVFEFQAKWNDFMTPLIYLNKTSLYTLSLGLQTFKVEHNTQWGLLMAGSVIFTLPMIVIFFLGQRYFMESVTTTGLKS
ncbi:MAG TPA: carbohydrate ABC transporter permease [Thermomicrobiales bacterium]|nr:carbohydrate ABC transporter permease [Thermomicrobiales bacterium]